MEAAFIAISHFSIMSGKAAWGEFVSDWVKGQVGEGVSKSNNLSNRKIRSNQLLH